MNHRHTSILILRAAILLLPPLLFPSPKPNRASPAAATATNGAPAVATPAPTATTTVTPDAPAPASDTTVSTYTVAAGDSLWLIAHNHHCSVASLRSLTT